MEIFATFRVVFAYYFLFAAFETSIPPFRSKQAFVHMLQHHFWILEVYLTPYQGTCSLLDFADVEGVFAIESNPGKEAITRRFALEGGAGSKERCQQFFMNMISSGADALYRASQAMTSLLLS
jgi:hypothetical protein